MKKLAPLLDRLDGSAEFEAALRKLYFKAVKV
jgi:hypothetical protein